MIYCFNIHTIRSIVSWLANEYYLNFGKKMFPESIPFLTKSNLQEYLQRYYSILIFLEFMFSKFHYQNAFNFVGCNCWLDEKVSSFRNYKFSS